MNQDLVNEVNDLIDLLAKSGFFSSDEILEILEDQFIEEEIDFSGFDISSNDFNNHNFSLLEECFKGLALKSIIGVHNCGYDFEEGVEDIFELYVHLFNNKYPVEGFCFYTFEDVEEAIESEVLRITFGDFQRDESKSLKIGKTVYESLSGAGFDLNWNESVNDPIEIVNFQWDKKYDENKEYEIEGAYDLFVGVIDEK